MPRLSRLIRPFTARSTYLRWTHLVLGAALAVPYLATSEVIGMVLRSPSFGSAASWQVAIAAQVMFAIVACAATALVPVARRLAGTAAKELLGGPITALEVDAAGSWPDRWRTACWFLIHLTLGGLIGLLTLVVSPFIVVLVTTPLLAPPPISLPDLPLLRVFGLGRPWSPLAGIALTAAGFYLVAGAGELLAKLAPVLLGPSAREQLMIARHQVERLWQRNRVASDLHDSVGHTLSVVTLQASAAARVLDSDPAFARQALKTIEESTRSALNDLDTALGALRGAGDEEADAPPGLTHLDQLLRSTNLAGLTVRTDIVGELTRIPAPVSHEAYRILREGLTNAMRHAGHQPVTMRIVVDPGSLELHMINPIHAQRAGSRRRSSGLGTDGIRHRVLALGGRMDAGADGPNWRLTVRIPLP